MSRRGRRRQKGGKGRRKKKYDHDEDGRDPKFVFKIILFVAVVASVVSGVTLIFYVTADDGGDSILDPGRPNDQVFDFTVQDIDGKQFTLSKQSSKLVMVDLMATWCGPCTDELPELEMVKERFGASIQLISLDIDTERENNDILRKYRDEHDVKWPMAMDTADLEGKYEVGSIPLVLLYDIKGNLLESWEGWRSSDEFIEGCEKHL